jgi:hypothetical protein
MPNLTNTTLLCLLWMLSPSIYAQNPLFKDWAARIPISDSGFIEVNQYIQFWNVISLRYSGLEADPRLDPHIRRGRLGVSGRLSSKVLFNASFAYDGVGKDPFTTAAGVPNAEDNTTFFPRDIQMTYRAHPLLNITTGYFRPRAGKESINSSSFCISQEKGLPSFHPRIHITGRGIGRETGINVGGLYTGSSFSLLYDVGIFDPNHPAIRGNGPIWSPLICSRMVFMLGDREMTEYLTTYFQSGFGERKGASVGFSHAYQSRTNLFRNNGFWGTDLQINWGPLDVVGEWLWLYRDSPLNDGSSLRTIDQSYEIKAAWNVPDKWGGAWQFCVMYTGDKSDAMFAQRVNPFTQATPHTQWSGGVNWLLNRNKLKLGLHIANGRRVGNGVFDNYTYLNPSLQFMM